MKALNVSRLALPDTFVKGVVCLPRALKIKEEIRFSTGEGSAFFVLNDTDVISIWLK